MRINHQKHHKTYIDNFTKTIEKWYSINYMIKACLPALKFHYKDLEPIHYSYIMRIHHQKHHKTYIDNFTKTIEMLRLAVTRCCSLL
ncbi:superoxide dismutase [Aphis craccivora]|uniref:superoxide dismutase n=1 Tax=Aphis craccivora TaxID=307492 RepID=A0A6G0WSK9_APHCR|nr:superoxide dismutase [Aphis craccivora]